MKELDIIAEECSGEVDVDTFMAVHEAATEGDYTFLTVDLNRKDTHPSMFRKCWNQWITTSIRDSSKDTERDNDATSIPAAQIAADKENNPIKHKPQEYGSSGKKRVKSAHAGNSYKKPYIYKNTSKWRPPPPPPPGLNPQPRSGTFM